MIAHAQPMACGNCGNGLFRMFVNQVHRDMLMAECAKCASVTVIKPGPPTLALEWGEQAEGILCRMGPTQFTNKKGNAT